MGRPAVALTILSLLLPIGTALGKHKFYQINTKFQETLSCNQFEYLYQEHLVVFLISMKNGIVQRKMSFAPLDIVFVEQLLPQGSFPNQIQLAFLHIPVTCTLVIFWTTFEQHNVPLQTTIPVTFIRTIFVIFILVLLQPFWSAAGSLSKTVLYDSYLIWRFALQLHKYNDIFLFLKFLFQALPV